MKNYIFDFGNVLAQFYPDKLTAPYIEGEDNIKLISDVVFDRLYWDKLDDGTISDEEVKEGICERLPGELQDIACTVYDKWIKTLIPVVGMCEIVDDLKKLGKKLYLLSNISKGFASGYKNVSWINELFSKFDGLVFSAEVGMVKPDCKIFEYVLDKFNLEKEDSVFIDDNINNIKSAVEVGIKGYLFDGDAGKLREYLKI